MPHIPFISKRLVLLALVCNWLALVPPATATETATAASPVSSETSIAQEAGKIVSAYVKMGWFSGTVLVQNQGHTIYEQAVGLADQEQAIENRLDTKFNLGSIAKNFTVVLTLQLVEAGKLQLDDKLSKFNLGFSSDIADKITIEHLLTHTAGFGDIFTAEYQSNRLGYDTLAKKLTLLMNEPLLFEPGSKSRYSNYGYVVLGVILEQVSKSSFATLLEKNVFKPLHLQHTRFAPDTADKEQSLRYSLKYDGSFVFVGITEHPGPDGGIESSAGDLARFYERLFNSDQLLSKEGVSIFKRLGKKSDYWRAFGGGLGISSAYEADFVTGYSVTVLANVDQLVAEIISGRIMDFIKTGEYSRIKQQANVFTYQLYTRLGAEQFQEQFAASYTAAGYDGFNGRVINEVGMQLTTEARFEQAFDFFQTLVHLYPKAPQAYDSLAWCYAKSGQGELAQKIFAQALEIKPDFSSDYSVDNYQSLGASAK
ncbi:MAG: serine hydrolase [Cephaloticoccus sp.]|nr:serine hydrolase [Cephaloticoccus sp.]